MKLKNISLTAVFVLVVTAGAFIVNAVSKHGEDGAKRSKAREQIASFDKALEEYRKDNGRWPTTAQGLEALYVKPVLPPVPSNWKGPYAEGELVRDPWSTDYVYKCSGDTYEIASYGSDGQAGGVSGASDAISRGTY